MIFNLTGGGGIRKPQFSYTGNYLETAYQGTDGVSYKLYTLTSSGVLTAKMKNADIWLCGGGSSGAPKRYIRNNAEQQGRRGGVLRKRDAADAQRKLYCYHWGRKRWNDFGGRAAFGSRCDICRQRRHGRRERRHGGRAEQIPVWGYGAVPVPLCGWRRRRAGGQRPKLLDDV